jgi:phosphoserine aminotransferase
MSIYFTPGPTQLHGAVADCLKEAVESDVCSMSHRSRGFEHIVERATSSLRRLLGIPNSHHIFFLGSATEAMERVCENCVAQKSFHLVNGEFSSRFFQIAGQVKRAPEKVEVPAGEGFDLSAIQIPSNAELICTTHNETSTGVTLPVDGIHDLKRRYPDKLIAVDMVSSAPVPEFDFDLIDCAFFSVQKGFGLPAGLGVLIAGNKAVERSFELAAQGVNTGSFHSFRSLVEYSVKRQTPETPNVLGIYLLARICESYEEDGIENIRAEIKRRAGDLYKYFDAHPWLRPYVQDPKFRSSTVLTLQAEQDLHPLREALAAQGLHVGAGYGKLKDRQIRIANFPVHSDRDFTRLLEALQ